MTVNNEHLLPMEGKMVEISISATVSGEIQFNRQVDFSDIEDFANTRGYYLTEHTFPEVVQRFLDNNLHEWAEDEVECLSYKQMRLKLEGVNNYTFEDTMDLEDFEGEYTLGDYVATMDEMITKVNRALMDAGDTVRTDVIRALIPTRSLKSA